MRSVIVILGFILLPVFAYAEHPTVNQSIYSNKSRLKVENLNDITDIIRDPTRINGSFKDMLDKIKPAANKQSFGNKYSGPELSLTALVVSQNHSYSAMLKVGEKVLLVKTGRQLSVMSKDQLYEIVIDEITGEAVRLTVFPANEQIILR